jgi:hypothetical protein
VDPSEVLNFLELVRGQLGCHEVAVACEFENLETVYVLERCGNLAATDRGRTFQYLDSSDDPAFANLDVGRARAICDRHGVELDGSDPEVYPEIVRRVGDLPLRQAVEAVAAAVDELFAVALELKQGRSWRLPE